MVATKNCFIGSIATACNIGLEVFIFISVFLGMHKCFLIMEAKGERLSMLDIAKLYCRKFLRLAPSYYGIWLLEWSFSSRFCLGKLCYRTNDLYTS